MKHSQLIKCFSLLQSFTAGACISHPYRHLLCSSETRRERGMKTLSQDYFSLSTCQCHTPHLHSPQLSHMEKCKSTMKRTYCKTHTLARDVGTYIALEPTFAFSLWNNLAFKSVRPFNMGAFNANLPECQHLVTCFWTFTAIPISATSQLPKSLCLRLIYTSLHDFYLMWRFSCEEHALTPPLFWTITRCCHLTVIKLKRKRVYQQPMSFHFCRKAPDTSVQKYFYGFYFMYSHTSLDTAFTVFQWATKEAQSWWNQQQMEDPHRCH